MSMTMSTTASDAVARTRELIPELRERAAQTALDRRLPQVNIDAMRRAGSLKTIQATRNGTEATIAWIEAASLPALAAAGQNQSAVPSDSQARVAGVLNVRRTPSMFGCCFHVGSSAADCGFCIGTRPMMAKRSGYFRATSIAKAFAVGSQLAGG